MEKSGINSADKKINLVLLMFNKFKNSFDWQVNIYDYTNNII